MNTIEETNFKVDQKHWAVNASVYLYNGLSVMVAVAPALLEPALTCFVSLQLKANHAQVIAHNEEAKRSLMEVTAYIHFTVPIF